MKKDEPNYTNEKFIIENRIFIVSDTEELLGIDCTPEVERKLHQEYVKGQYNLTELKEPENINFKNLENVFTNEADIKAMKQLSPLEKFTIYTYAFYPQYIEKLCTDCHISPEGFTQIMKDGVKKFLKYQKLYSKKYPKNNYKRKRKFKKNYYKKGGGSNV